MGGWCEEDRREGAGSEKLEERGPVRVQGLPETSAEGEGRHWTVENSMDRSHVDSSYPLNITLVT
jgi:hypothetical protein